MLIYSQKEKKGSLESNKIKRKLIMNESQSISITVDEMVNALAEKDLDFIKKLFRQLFKMSVMRQMAKEIMAEIEKSQGRNG